MPPVYDHQYPLLLLSSIHRRRYKKSSDPQTFRIPCDLLCVVAHGQGMLRIDNQVFDASPYRVFYLRPSMDVEMMLESGSAECYILMLRHLAVSKRNGEWNCTNSDAGTSLLLPQGRLPLKHVKPIDEEIKQLYQDSKAKTKNAFEMQLRFQSLIQSIVQDRSEPEDAEETSKGIDQSIAYMFKHYREKMKLTVLSDIAGLTPTSYSRSFKKAKGFTPVEYLNRIRIDASKRLLRQSDRSIKDVAESVGFGNEFYFSRMFKRTVGISPALYMRSNRLKVAVASCFRYEDNLRSLGMDPLAVMNAYRHIGSNATEPKRSIQEQLNLLRNAGPDLIVADCRHLSFYEQLKQIAPTVVLEYTMDWRKNYIRIAELVGREKEAQHHLNQVEQKVKVAQKMLARAIGKETVSFVRMYSEKMRVQGFGDHPLNELLYGDLGLNPGSGVPLNERYREFPLTCMPPFETDHLFIYNNAHPASESEVLSTVRQNASWMAMEAARNSRIQTVGNWIGMSWTPAGQNQIIDELLQWKA